MNYIKTERFLLDPHHGSGTKIVLPEIRRTTPPKEHHKWNGTVITTEPIEFYRKTITTTKKPEKKPYVVPIEWDGVVPQHIRNRPWLIKSPNTILDDYIIFETNL